METDKKEQIREVIKSYNKELINRLLKGEKSIGDYENLAIILASVITNFQDQQLVEQRESLLLKLKDLKYTAVKNQFWVDSKQIENLISELDQLQQKENKS